jgi:hypothetical protein
VRTPALTALALVLLAVAGALTGCTGEASIPLENASPDPTASAPAREDCSTRSFADFTGAFADPANLVVGPFALVGGATPTTAPVVERFGGQKYPLLVKGGHVVTVRLPAELRGVAVLAYGPLPQGEITVSEGHEAVTFTACEDGAVTFWSGGIVVTELACVPLDLYVDGDPKPRRAAVELGRPCQET